MNRSTCTFCGSSLTTLSAAVSKCGCCGLLTDRTTGRPIWRFAKEGKTVTL